MDDLSRCGLIPPPTHFPPGVSRPRPTVTSTRRGAAESEAGRNRPSFLGQALLAGGRQALRQLNGTSHPCFVMSNRTANLKPFEAPASPGMSRAGRRKTANTSLVPWSWA